MTGEPTPSESDEVRATLPPEEPGTLLLTEIYTSIQGETSFAGLPFVLVRTARCNLRCVWCDSAFTFRGGERRPVAEVLAEVLATGVPNVLVTGGEPLLQPSVHPFMRGLCDAGRTVLLETGGSLDIAGVDPRVRRIVDLKCPGSGESDRNLWSNVDHLGPLDEVKFVLADRADYEWARRAMAEHDLAERCGEVLLSPVAGDGSLPARVVEWMLADGLRARFQIQVHKVVWPPDERGR